MKRSELKEILEKCFEEIGKNKHYKSYDATVEIMQAIDEYHSGSTERIVSALNIKRGSLPTNKQIEEIAEQETFGKMDKKQITKAGYVGLIKIGMEVGMEMMRDRIEKNLQEEKK